MGSSSSRSSRCCARVGAVVSRGPPSGTMSGIGVAATTSSGVWPGWTLASTAPASVIWMTARSVITAAVPPPDSPYSARGRPCSIRPGLVRNSTAGRNLRESWRMTTYTRPASEAMSLPPPEPLNRRTEPSGAETMVVLSAPDGSVCRVPSIPSVTRPPCSIEPSTSSTPPNDHASRHMRGSAMPTAGSVGCGMNTPISSSNWMPGALVRCASSAATWGSPSPTSATSSSRSRLAAATAIISPGVQSALIASLPR